MLSERETALCSAVLALSGTDTMASMIPWPMPGHQRLDTPSDSAGCSQQKNQPIPLVTLISVGVTPQSSPDTSVTQSVCPSVSAAAPRLEQTHGWVPRAFAQLSQQTRGDTVLQPSAVNGHSVNGKLLRATHLRADTVKRNEFGRATHAVTVQRKLIRKTIFKRTA